MALIGVLARVDVARRTEVSDELARLSGVSLFSVDEDERIGILVQRDSLDEVHAALKDEVERIPGVLGAWPVYTYAGDLTDDECVLDELVADNTQSVEADVDG